MKKKALALGISNKGINTIKGKITLRQTLDINELEMVSRKDALPKNN
jgi:hypothetical protein